MKKPTKISLVGLALTGLVVLTVVIAKLVFAAGSATMSLTPASGTFAQGDTVSVNIYEDSGSDTVNAVQANFSYPASLLSFVGVTDSPAFGVVAQNSVSGGSAQIARGTSTPVAGSQLVATIRFTAAAAGDVTLSFTGGSAVVRSTDNGAETLSTTGAGYTINSPATLSISPATKTYNKGDTISAVIYENSGATAVNAVQANLSYPSNITFVSIDGAGSAFSIAAQGTGGSGSVKIGRGTTTPVTGSQLVATVNFTASSTGTAAIAFTSGSAVVRSSDNGAESLTETGANYTITTPGSSTSGTKSTKPGSASGSGASSPSTTSSASAQPPVTTNTDKKGPVISQIKITNLSLKTATITWQTSEPATSEVNYGLNTKYILNVTDPTLTKNHSVKLSSKDLLPHTTYHFIVKSVDSTGNLAFSKDLTFKTEPVNAKSGISSFWAVFAAIVVVGAGAYVGWGYINRMSGKLPPPPSTPGPSGGPAAPISPSSGPGGGAIIKPSAASTTSVPPSAVVSPSPSPPKATPVKQPSAK